MKYEHTHGIHSFKPLSLDPSFTNLEGLANRFCLTNSEMVLFRMQGVSVWEQENLFTSFESGNIF